MSEFFWGGSWWHDLLFVGAWVAGWLVVLFVAVLVSVAPRRPPGRR